ncbi:MAG TPA: TAXI family TRAP transporter solute-binding subunit [Trueperaceae bacterium]
MRLARTLLASLVALFISATFAQTQLSIATGGTGGTYYPVGGGYAELINDYLDGYQAVAEVTGASVENVGLISRGDSDIALALADTVYQAYTGTGQLEGRQLENLRSLGVAYANTVHIVTLADSGIESISDLEGKVVSVGAPGSGTEVSAQTLLNANGITYDQIDERRLNFNETAAALRDGQIEAGFWSVGPPTSSILDLATTRDIKILSLSDEEIQNALEAEPTFARTVIPAETYPGQEEDVVTVGTPNVIVVSAEMDDQLAYDFLDVLYSHIDEIIAIHPSGNQTTPQNSIESTPIPLHPGAVAYYEDQGLEVPDDVRPPQ